jgi:hypothetical protein
MVVKKLFVMSVGAVFWALLFSIFAVGNPAPALTVSSADGKVGDILTLDVVMINNPGFDVLQCEIDYDPSCLKLMAVDNCIEGDGKVYLPSGNSNVFIYFGLKYSEANEILGKVPTVNVQEAKIMCLTFEILAAGEAEVTVNVIEALKFDSSYTPRIFAVANGVGKIKASSVPVVHIHSDADGEWETDDFSHWHTCFCGEVFDKLDHSSGNATCTLKPKCEICAVEYGSVSPTAHTVSTQRIARDELLVRGSGIDCLSYKQYYYECTECHRSTAEKWTDTVTGDHKFGVLIPAEGEIHTVSELKAGIAAHYRCAACLKLFNDKKEPATMELLMGEVPAHSFSDFVFDAFRHKRICSCGKTESFGDHIYDSDADMVCDVCSYDRSCKHLGGLSHMQYNSASCTAAGNIENWYCKDCGKSFDGADPSLASQIMNLIIPALGHSFDKKLEDEAHIRYIAKSCSEHDSFWYSCSVCGEISDKDFFENGNVGPHHTVIVPGYPKTCEGDGISDSEFCTLCGVYVTDPIIIPSLGHVFGEWKTIKEPTSAEQGSKMRICENCDAQEIEIIPALPEETTEADEETTELTEDTTEVPNDTTEVSYETTEISEETTENIVETTATSDETTLSFDETTLVFDETTDVEKSEINAGIVPWLLVITVLLVINLFVLIIVLKKKNK